MNVHRSRKLQGTDPATFEMIKKIQMSQQWLMRKAEEVVERDAIIEEKTQEYQDLKDYVSRVPSPNTIERTSRSRSVIKDKTRQVMALKSELKMSELLTKEYGAQIEKYSLEVDTMKRKYSSLQRKLTARDDGSEDWSYGEHPHSEKNRRRRPHVLIMPAPTTVRHMGGGFVIKEIKLP
mmetsp:Transcript_29155/g.57997  ORF Transcript_29155/g.57997 Transcript_29155/m.57997 type:complete len:179 (-) Transcript_29155:56-592(-)